MKSYWVASTFNEDGTELELRCPKCGCTAQANDPAGDVTWTDFISMSEYLGKKTTCYECGYEFVITENCWRPASDC